MAFSPASEWHFQQAREWHSTTGRMAFKAGLFSFVVLYSHKKY
jgi:hypothetical protein